MFNFIVFLISIKINFTVGYVRTVTLFRSYQKTITSKCLRRGYILKVSVGGTSCN